MKTTESCGCTHNGQAWISKCGLCSAADRQLAARWAAEHIRRSPGTRFTDEYLMLAAEHDASILDTAWLTTAPEQGALL